MSLDGVSLGKKPGFSIRCGVFGVGGGGNNIVNALVSDGFSGPTVTPVVANTDNQVLQSSLCPNRIQLGPEITHGWGAGGDPEVGRQAVLASKSVIEEHLSELDMIVVLMTGGGGTGSYGGVELCSIARSLGLLVIGIYIMPFHFEGRKRREIAENGWSELRVIANTCIQIDNERLMHLSGSSNLSYLDALDMVNGSSKTIVFQILSVIGGLGVVNVDYADLLSVTQNGGLGTVGVGIAEGEHAGLKATEIAVQNPLLHCDITGAQAAIVYFAGGARMSLKDITEGSDYIRNKIAPDATLHIGSSIDPTSADRMSVTVIATGIRPCSDKGPTFKSVDTSHNTADISPRVVLLGDNDSISNSDIEYENDEDEYYWWQRIRKKWFS